MENTEVKDVNVEQLAKDLSLDTKNEVQPEKVEQKKPSLSYDQNMALKQYDGMFNLLQQTIDRVIETERAYWLIMTDMDEGNKLINPYHRLIELMEYKVGQFKQFHHDFLVENNLISQQEKENEQKNKPAVYTPSLVHIKQVKTLK